MRPPAANCFFAPFDDTEEKSVPFSQSEESLVI